MDCDGAARIVERIQVRHPPNLFAPLPAREDANAFRAEAVKLDELWE